MEIDYEAGVAVRKGLKGKYFPDGNLMSATRKRRCSETWRSILAGRDMLKRGLIKRIGPGEADIWHDNWITGSNSFRPLIQLPAVGVEKVKDLFAPGTRVWDEALVRQAFLPLDAEEILKIKPGTNMEADIEAWAFEKSGLYTVKSAYRLLKEEQMAGAMARTSEAGASGDERSWKLVWNLKVPPKVGVFWWRVMHNFLPSKQELKRRHVILESHCELCGDPDQSLYHIVFLCPAAKRFWAEVKNFSGVSVPLLHPLMLAKVSCSTSVWRVESVVGSKCTVPWSEGMGTRCVCPAYFQHAGGLGQSATSG